MADEKPARKAKDGREWRLFVLPALLAAIGAYFALTKTSPPPPTQTPVQAGPSSTKP